jgi:hypothetical protein
VLMYRDCVVAALLAMTTLTGVIASRGLDPREAMSPVTRVVGQFEVTDSRYGLTPGFALPGGCHIGAMNLSILSPAMNRPERRAGRTS